MFTKEEIGAILKKLRLLSGKTQREVAETIGRKQQVIGHWETGYSQPDADTLFILCELYGTTVNDAFGFNDEKHEVDKIEYEHIKKYRRLNDNNRQAVDITVNTMLMAQDAEIAKEPHPDIKGKAI